MLVLVLLAPLALLVVLNQFLVMHLTVTMISLLQIPILGKAQFAAQPLPVVQASGLAAEFECHYPGAALHSWRSNGVLYDDDQFPSDFTRIPPSANFPVAKLIIPATTQYNNTVVQCEALVPEGNVFVPVTSNNGTLTVHDARSPKLETTEYSATVSWDNLFTTDLTFCVDAVSAVSSETLASVCVSGTQHTFTSLDTDLCEEVSFTVTPTDGGRNGTSSEPVTGYFQETRDIVFFQCQETQCEAVLTTPLSCEVELTFSTTDALPHIMHTTTISGNVDTTYPLDSVVANRHYSVDLTITTSSGTRYSLLHQTISTHDTVDASARPSITTEGALSVSCTFAANTAARGYLAVISSDLSSGPIFSAQYNTAGTEDVIEGVGRGQYSVTFFDLESDGLPVHSRTDPVLIGGAFSVTGVDIPIGSRHQQLTESVNRLEAVNVERITDTTVNISCSSVADCLVLVYDYTTPELLITLFVVAREKRSLNLQPEKRYSFAFYAIDSSNMLLADKLPGRVVNLDPTATPSSTVTSSRNPTPTTGEAVDFLPTISRSAQFHSSAFGIAAIMIAHCLRGIG